MTDQPVTGPQRVGGSRAYVTAHRIMNHGDLAFEYAFALTKLVLEQNGGPVPCTGKGALMKKPMATALAKLGLVDVWGPHQKFVAATQDALDLVEANLLEST